MSFLNVLRRMRDTSGFLKSAHSVLRGPYYKVLDALYPRGVEVALPGALHVKVAPRFTGMRLEQYERALSEVVDRRLRPGMTVIDIGAHVGIHTLRFIDRVGSAGLVIAVEPSPANAQLLRTHLGWNNRRAEVIEAAIGEREGEIEFAFRHDPADPAGFANSMAYDIGGRTSKVRVTTIDSICGSLSPDVMKIDIEGAELLALRGAQVTLSRTSPLLIVAVHPDAMRSLGTSPIELVQFLDALGYSAFGLDGRRVTEPGFEEVIFEKRGGLA